MTRAVLAPAEVARLDAYARTMRTGMVALFLVASMANLIPRHPDAVPAETVSGEGGAVNIFEANAEATCRVCGDVVSLAMAPLHVEDHAQRGEFPAEAVSGGVRR